MTYSYDMRERAVKYVQEGGLRKEACRIFSIDAKTLYRWMQREDLHPKQHGLRRLKLDKEALAAHVASYPDMLLRERAAHFGVRTNSIWGAMKVLKMTKKNDTLCGKESGISDKFSA
jgi:putative transposase